MKPAPLCPTLALPMPHTRCLATQPQSLLRACCRSSEHGYWEGIKILGISQGTGASVIHEPLSLC